MDVGELIAFRPEFGLKPVNEKTPTNERIPSSGNPKKRSRLEPPKTSRYSVPPPVEAIQNIQQIASSHLYQSNKKPDDGPNEDIDREKLIEEKLNELEAGNKEDEGPLDALKLKKIILTFEKVVMKNQELRIKFPDDPKKFMESEIYLHESIEELHVIATVPELYPLIIEFGVIKIILSLFAHENSDISVAVVDLIQEMTDIEDVEDSEGICDFIDALMDEQIMPTLVHNLQRLDENVKQESEGVHTTLGIIENLGELRPEICNEAYNSGLLTWLLKRLKAKIPFDGNKLYVTEILAVCVQNNAENQRFLGSMEGIDVLLQQLAQYKRHDPHSIEEHEMMENLFDILCSCLLLPVNRDPFLQGEGLQLMNLMLREKKLSRNGALRVLDHALSAPEGADNCNKFIDILGLRTIFPLFMKTPKKHGSKGLTKEQHEEHVISIISWLLKNAKANQKQRLMSKFTENDHEKVDRLLELHFKYLEKVLTTNTVLEEQARAENLDEDVMYMRRLDGGLFTLQLVDYIMLDICAAGPPSIKKRVLKILNVRNASIKTIKNIIREYASNLGDESDDKSEEQEKILELLNRFQNV